MLKQGEKGMNLGFNWRVITGAVFLLLPVLAVAVAVAGRDSFWASSASFSSEWPSYLIAAFVVEAPPVAAAILGRRAGGLVARFDNSSRLMIWGGYQLLCGIAMIQLFSANELWLGSTLFLYLGLGSVIAGTFLRVTAER